MNKDSPENRLSETAMPLAEPAASPTQPAAASQALTTPDLLLDCITLSDATRHQGITTFLNPYSYLQLRRQPELLQPFDQICIDGMLLCRLLQLAGVRLQRRSFDMTSLAPSVLADAEQRQLRVYLIGSEPGIVDRAATVFRTDYPALNIIGTRHGFFDSDSQRSEVLDSIRDSNPDLVIVGMGSPWQERFLTDLRQHGWQGTGYTCGGFLHQTASAEGQYYPAFFDRCNLRWLYRMIDEPKLIRRYFLDYPVAVTAILSDILRLKRRRRSLQIHRT